MKRGSVLHGNVIHKCKHVDGVCHLKFDQIPTFSCFFNYLSRSALTSEMMWL